ncbi:prepilin-type N-terminal cleavage/methylation domain-containing protein [Candidatus Saccharibacteria bacterium]|jgi:prepilin-type N-terminal cleavage/methylation domain-containing protein|nr:prepilin-type N-terminal cleavage/methylation domain-containing protein [Candidatus Saccharibacteria bacterium]
MNKSKNKGFTILELLIVIVVIGVLAGLVLTAYGRIGDRAQAAVVRRIVQQYSKGLAAYRIDKGHYPLPSELSASDRAALDSVGGVCIGKGYSSGCSSTINRAIELESFNDLISPYVGRIPNINPHDVPITIIPDGGLSATFTGIAFYNIEAGKPDSSITIDEVKDEDAGFSYFVYALDEPNAKCTGGQTLGIADFEGNFILNGARNTLTDSKNTACAVLLVDSIYYE